jgi:hypothetical protein
MPNSSEILPFIPGGREHTPLFCAGKWIATRGGTTVIRSEDSETWKAAFDYLLSAIVQEKVSVFGVKVEPGFNSTVNLTLGERVKMDGSVFADCKITENPCEPRDYDIEIEDSDVLLRSFAFDECDWRDGFSDELVTRNGDIRWTRLTLLRAEVLKRWPYDDPDLYTTDGPGRPTPKRIIEKELKRRAANGELLPGIGRQARNLYKWLQEEHPDAPQADAKAIAAILRELGYRELLSKQK